MYTSTSSSESSPFGVVPEIGALVRASAVDSCLPGTCEIVKLNLIQSHSKLLDPEWQEFAGEQGNLWLACQS